MLIFDQLKKNDPQLRAITWTVLIGLGILLIGLWFVQVVSHRHFSENQKAQSFRTVRIPAIRGKILDRHERPLAENQPSYNISLYLEELRQQFKEEWRLYRPKTKLARSERVALEAQARYRVVSRVVQDLSTALQQPVGLDYGQFLKHYTNQLALPLLLLTNLNPIQIARFQERAGSSPGLDLEVQPLRVYPHRTTAAHLLGFLTKDNSSAEGEDAFFNFRLPDWRGRVGTEWAFDEQLRGRAGVKSVLVNSLGYRQSETIWTPAEPGKNVVLSIDLDIQQAAENALQGAGRQGAVVVLDPNTGDLLALASWPTFDPNSFIPHINHDDYEKLTDPVLRPQINRATQENYAPGSIFKIVTGLACLEAGLDPAQKFYNPPNPADPAHGYIQVKRHTFKDLSPPGEYDFRRGFARSSNFYFITNGLNAGIERIVEIGERLHLGERTGLPTGQEVTGSFPNRKMIRTGWGAVDTGNLCIGQGRIDVTPLQMAVMTAAIANGGKVLWPRLVDRVESQEPTAEEKLIYPQGRVRDELGASVRNLQIIREAMLADVEDSEGTGRAARVPGLRVCGKTGTAQIMDSRNQIIGHTTWFASFAPYETPRYVVVVMVEGAGSGGGTCAPLAQKVYQAIQYQETQSKPKPLVARTD
jgi:penicillin-binding protein 2